MRDHEKSSGFGGRTHLVTLCFVFLGAILLNLPETVYSAAIMVEGYLSLNGNNISVDSYNSTDPTKSTGGRWDPAKAGDAGDVICAGTELAFPFVGNSMIYGRFYDAAGAIPNLGADGGIGTHAWLSSNFGIEPGYFVPFLSFPFPNVTLPDYSEFIGPVIPGGTVVTTNSGVPVTNAYDNIICGNYFATGTLGNTIVTCPSTLVLPNGYSIAALTIAAGASLTVYAGGGALNINANAISNQAGLPGSFVIYCTSNVSFLLATLLSQVFSSRQVPTRRLAPAASLK